MEQENNAKAQNALKGEAAAGGSGSGGGDGSGDGSGGSMVGEGNQKERERDGERKDKHVERDMDAERHRERDHRDHRDHRDGRDSRDHRDSRHREREHRERRYGGRSRSRERGGRPYDRDRRDRDRDRDRYDHRERYDREREREGERYNHKGESRGNRSRSPEDPLSRDKRTVFVMQLAQRVRSPDLKDIFRQAGRIRSARIVFDKVSRRSKGVGYVEFYDEASVPKAIGLTGHKFFGVPIIVQVSEAEKNRLAMEAEAEAMREKRRAMAAQTGRLYVAAIHETLSEHDIRKVFEPFGRLDEVSLLRDANGRFRGVAYVGYVDARV